MAGKAAKITLTERQQQELMKLTRSSTCPQGVALRANIILLAFEGNSNEAIALRLGYDRHAVGIWRQRWAEFFHKLTLIECSEKPSALPAAIAKVLADSPRSGCPATFSAEEVALILKVSCEPPSNSDRPITHWSARELADEVQKRGIVKKISTRQVGRFLQDAELQPHRSRYWLNARPKNPEEFLRQVRAVCDCYRQAAASLEMDIHTISVDEMTGIQALERKAATLGMKPGQEEKREVEYKRHGTTCLMGNLEVATGMIVSPTVQTTRTEEDFAKHIAATVATDAAAGWIFILDNLTTHCSETLVRYVAEECKVVTDLGKKGKRGILKSVVTRKAFLTDEKHRIRFVYVPKHTSWLNQIEIWFGILMRRVIKRGNFTSVSDLRDKILTFIDYFNETMAKPFKWTYTGRPLNV